MPGSNKYSISDLDKAGREKLLANVEAELTKFSNEPEILDSEMADIDFDIDVGSVPQEILDGIRRVQERHRDADRFSLRGSAILESNPLHRVLKDPTIAEIVDLEFNGQLVQGQLIARGPTERSSKAFEVPIESEPQATLAAATGRLDAAGLELEDVFDVDDFDHDEFNDAGQASDGIGRLFLKFENWPKNATCLAIHVCGAPLGEPESVITCVAVPGGFLLTYDHCDLELLKAPNTHVDLQISLEKGAKTDG